MGSVTALMGSVHAALTEHSQQLAALHAALQPLGGRQGQGQPGPGLGAPAGRPPGVGPAPASPGASAPRRSWVQRRLGALQASAGSHIVF